MNKNNWEVSISSAMIYMRLYAQQALVPVKILVEMAEIYLKLI